MNRLFVKIVAGFTTVTVVSGCATLPQPGTALTADQRKQAQTDCVAQYTVVSALGGAILGQLLGGNTRSTLIGAAAGGVLGGAIAWGHCLNLYSNLASFPVADATQTASLTGWQPARGKEVKIESFGATPATLAAGSTVDLNGSYYVMAPDSVKDVKVVESRMVAYYDPQEQQWKDLGSVDQTVTAALGTRRAQGTFELPKDVPEGRYRITMKVNALGKTDTATQEIAVTKA